MKNKGIKTLLFIFIASMLLSACGENRNTTIKVGLTGTDSQQWEYVKETAAKEGITIELLFFTDYMQPNLALSSGEVQLTSNITIAYLEEINNEFKDKITPIATTILAPMGIYSNKIKNLTEVKSGDTVTVPNEGSNLERALFLLRDAKLIEIGQPASKFTAIDDIIKNPLGLKIVAMASNQIPPTLDDAAIGVINNNVAVDAGFTLKDSLYHETNTAKKYINVIASREDEKSNETYRRIVEIFQTDEVKEIIKRESKDNSIPIFEPLSIIGY